MTTRVQLIQEIKQASDSLVEELLNLLLTLKGRAVKTKVSLNQNEQETPQTVLERMGGIPQYLLRAGNLSDRDSRRAIVSNRIQQ